MPEELVLDLETKKAFSEVGGKYNMHMLGVSVVGVYSYRDDQFYAFEEKEFPRLEEMLANAGRVIGFNSKHFDFPVLQPHVSINLREVPHLDLMEDVELGAGFRISLDNLAQASLGAGKSGNGLQAITWWREGKVEAVKKYCLQDVCITRDLYEYGKKNGHILFDSRDTRARAKIPVRWAEIPAGLQHNQGKLF